MLFICMALIDDEEDKKSFAELYNKYETTAISIALKILKNREAAEDACAEAFLSIAKCYERIKNLEPQNLERYISVTVKNASFDIYNNEKKLGKKVLLDDNFSDLTDESLSNRDYAEIVRCIKKLSYTDQEILYLRINFDLKYNEIADTLHISNAAARKRMQSAKENLVALLEKEEIYHE